MTNNHYLVKWASNWADEMDVHGFMVFNEKEFKKFEEDLEFFKKDKRFDLINRFSIFVGSNEDIIYEGKNKQDELISEITINEISKEEYDFTLRTFGHYYGFYDGIEFIMDYEGRVNFPDIGVDVNDICFRCKKFDKDKNECDAEFIGEKFNSYDEAEQYLKNLLYFNCGSHLFSNGKHRVRISAYNKKTNREIKDYFDKKKKGKHDSFWLY